MFFGNLDNLLLSEVGLHRRILSPLANDIGLVSLLSVHRETILVTVDGDGLEGELVGSTEDTDWDFTSVGDEDLVQLHDRAVRSQAGVDGVGILVSVAVSVRRAELVAAAVLSHGGQRGQLLLSLLLLLLLTPGRRNWNCCRGGGIQEPGGTALVTVTEGRGGGYWAGKAVIYRGSAVVFCFGAVCFCFQRGPGIGRGSYDEGLSWSVRRLPRMR